MKSFKALLGLSLAAAIVVVGITSNVLAWHPEGVITKKVQNITTGGALSEADTSETAVGAKPGDTLKYVIEVRNKGNVAKDGTNDMAKTVMKDTLPEGIELVSNPSQRQITENLGTLKPGQAITKEYLVKVTAKTDVTIKNTACFTGDSKANDNPQKGCNPAVIKVTVPPTPPTPEVPTPEVPETPKPETPKPEAPAPKAPTQLPQTGMTENIIGSLVALLAASYVAYRYVESRRKLTDSLANR